MQDLGNQEPYEMYAKPESGPLTVPCRINGKIWTLDLDEAIQAAELECDWSDRRRHYVVVQRLAYGTNRKVYDTSDARTSK